MSNKIDQSIVRRIANGTASDLDYEVFNDWLDTLDVDKYKAVLDDFENLLEPASDESQINLHLWDRLREKIDDYSEPVQDKLFRAEKKSMVALISIAASILVVIGVVFYLKDFSVNPPQDISKIPFEQRVPTDISPGKKEAYLELANGERITLDEFASKKILQQSGVRVTQSDTGKLIYDFKNAIALSSTEPVYHTISTPKGGEYQLVLPDGTQVWLNASSHLKFPTVFGENERKVELSGEAYFDVVSNKEKPFIVQTEKETVQVLGTEFNISSYADEISSRTTLLEGEVKVSLKNNDKRQEILNPGQQSITHGNHIKVAEVNVDEVVSWKNGEFMFNRESVESVMRKLARWYDVEVIYETPIGKNEKIWGTVSRFDNISEVLKFIEGTKVAYFRVEGRRVYVTN